MAVTNTFPLPYEPVPSLESYVSMESGETQAKARRMTRGQIISEVTKSGLCSRSGARVRIGRLFRFFRRRVGRSPSENWPNSPLLRRAHAK